jgi:hypothetical protein
VGGGGHWVSKRTVRPDKAALGKKMCMSDLYYRMGMLGGRLAECAQLLLRRLPLVFQLSAHECGKYVRAEVEHRFCVDAVVNLLASTFGEHEPGLFEDAQGPGNLGRRLP